MKKPQNIDHHILRQLKFKIEFTKSHPLPLTEDQSLFFNTRSKYEPLSTTTTSLSNSSSSSSSSTTTTTSEPRTMETELISMFLRADLDRNGSLDPSEVEDLLLHSPWGFDKQDVDIIMNQHDTVSSSDDDESEEVELLTCSCLYDCYIISSPLFLISFFFSPLSLLSSLSLFLSLLCSSIIILFRILMVN